MGMEVDEVYKRHAWDYEDFINYHYYFCKFLLGMAKVHNEKDNQAAAIIYVNIAQ